MSTSIIRDPHRLASLRRTALLDQAPDPRFDRITRLTTTFLRVPTALISLVDDDRQWFASYCGLAEPWATGRQTPLSHSFCQHVVTAGQPFTVSDARIDPLVQENLAIPDLGVIAYAGVPLTTADGQVLGALCAIDGQPRAWNADEIATLEDLAAMVMTAIERQDAALARDYAVHAWENSQQHLRELVEDVEDLAICMLDRQGTIVKWSTGATTMTGYSESESLGRSLAGLYLPDDDQGGLPAEHLAQTAAEGRLTLDGVRLRRDGSRLRARVIMTALHGINDEIAGYTVVMHELTRQKPSEAALLRLCIEHTPAAVAMFDREMRYILTSQRWLADYGLGDQVLIGRSHYEVFPGIPDRWKQIHQQCLAGATVQSDEDPFPRADGTLDWLRWKVRPWHDRTGAIGGIVMFTEVITARKQADELLLQAQTALERRVVERTAALAATNAALREEIAERLRVESELAVQRDFGLQVMTAMGQGLAVTDVDGTFTFANPACAQLLGTTPERLIGEELAVVLGPEAGSVLLDVGPDGTVARGVETRVQRADGQLVDVILSCVPRWHQGTLAGMITVITDLRKLKLAEAALRESEARLQLALDAAEMGVWDWNLGTAQITLSEQLQRLCGRERAASVWTTDAFLACVHPDDRTLIIEAAHDSVAKSQSYRCEFRVVWEDGSVHWIHSSGQVVLDPGGAPAGILGIAVDITERKGLEAQIWQAQRMESIGLLAGGVAHDFNNILMGILGYADLGLNDAALPEDVHESLYEIRKAAQRAASLTKQLLAFARKQVIAPRLLNLNDLVLDVDGLLRRLLQSDIELVTLLANDLAPVNVDPSQIEQVLVNLAVNARDAMPQGGKLTIESANVTLNQDEVRPYPGLVAGTYVRVTVTDTGVGMSEKVKQRIFEPFFTTKEQGKGTGLGLATCYGIIKQHGGYIWCESKPGQGTSFTLYLSAATGITDLGSSNDLGTAHGGQETVLVVDDEPAVRRLITRVLQEQGYTVLVAANGYEAEAAARTLPPNGLHLLLSDVVMPQLNGTAVAQRVRALHPELKVIWMSGYPDPTISRNGELDAGTRFLQKPFPPSVLTRTLREALDESDQRAALHHWL